MTGVFRPPVVLLHALPLSSSMWDAQTRALRARGHQVIAADQRGFGTAPLGVSPPSLDVVADDLARDLDAQGVEDVVLAGASMGGYVAMAFLRRYRHRVRALALLAARGDADSPQAAAARRAFADMILDDAARERTVARTVPSLLGASTRKLRPNVVTQVTTCVAAAEPKSVAWAQHAIAARPDSMGVLRTTDVPAVAVAGEEDELTSAAEMRNVARALPHGRLVVVPGAGHLLPLEAPDLVTELLVALAAEAAPARTGKGAG